MPDRPSLPAHTEPLTPDPRTMPRITEVAPNTIFCDAATDFTDGYRVTVGWSEEDCAWLARVSGLTIGEQIGDGVTKEAALLSLVCGLSACSDAQADAEAESRASLRAVEAERDALQAELHAIAFGFGNPQALDGLTLAQKAAKCVGELARMDRDAVAACAARPSREREAELDACEQHVRILQATVELLGRQERGAVREALTKVAQLVENGEIGIEPSEAREIREWRDSEYPALPSRRAPRGAR